MVLFDNDPIFLQGLQDYNQKLNLVCAGSPCGANLSPNTVIKALS